MQKRFKHIPTGDIYLYSYRFYCNNNISIPMRIVEDKNSKDWKEVKEKTYRITKIKNKVNSIIVFTKDKAFFENFENTHSVDNNPEMFVKMGCTIEQVERLSDREIFSIKDKTTRGTIKRFEIQDSRILIWFEENFNTPCYLNSFENPIKKIETPVSTTEDGVECYPNNHPKLFWVITDTFQVGKDDKNSMRNLMIQGFKYFAKKENRDEWIINHKPLFSIEDIKKYFHNTPIQIEVLELVAKSRV